MEIIDLLREIQQEDITEITGFTDDKIWYLLNGDSLDSFVNKESFALKCKLHIARKGKHTLKSGPVLSQGKIIYECKIYIFDDIFNEEFSEISEADSIFKACEYL